MFYNAGILIKLRVLIILGRQDVLLMNAFDQSSVRMFFVNAIANICGALLKDRSLCFRQPLLKRFCCNNIASGVFQRSSWCRVANLPGTLQMQGTDLGASNGIRLISSGACGGDASAATAASVSCVCGSRARKYLEKLGTR